MNIIRHNVSPLSTGYRPIALSEQFGWMMDNLFDDFFSPIVPSLARWDTDLMSGPRLSMVETDKTLEMEAELPGVAKEDISVTIHNNRVSINAESRHGSGHKEGGNAIYAERFERRYSRSFTLPSDVDDAKAEAKFEDGIRTLSLPKKESVQVNRIPID